MPDPFLHYEGVPVLDVPADPPCPEIPALSVLGDVAGSTTAQKDQRFGPNSFLFGLDQRVQVCCFHGNPLCASCQPIFRELARN